LLFFITDHAILTQLLRNSEESKQLALENQKNIRLLSLSQQVGPDDEDTEVVERFDRKLETVVDLEKLDGDLQNKGFRKRMVHFSAN